MAINPKVYMIIDLNDQTFAQEIEQSKGVILVDFHALWCGPCKRQGPIVEALADKFKDNFKVVKVDVDEAPVTAEKFGISSIPTLVFFKNGQMVDTLLGLQQPATLESKINQLLAS